MDSKIKFLTILILLGTLFQPMPLVANTSSSGLTILAYQGDSLWPEMVGFKGNWTARGNTFLNYTTYDFSNLVGDDIDILLILHQFHQITTQEVDAIADWFNMGKKMLWIGGDSDFSGFYIPSKFANPILEGLGTSIRISSVSLEDPQSKSDFRYRLLANETGVSSELTDYVTSGVEKAMFHGPTAIHYETDNIAYDLRNATLGQDSLNGVDIIMNSSAAAIALDSDLSLKEQDFYAYSANHGNYPVMVSDQFNDSMLVVSGESIFLDYQRMYGTTDQTGTIEHQGAKLVDQMILYYYSKYADKEGPSIGKSIISPPNATEIDLIEITAEINDPSGINQAILSYKIDSSYWFNDTMEINETHVIGKIPPNSDAYDIISYKIYAEDNRGFWSVSDVKSFTLNNSDIYSPDITIITSNIQVNSTENALIRALVTDDSIIDNVMLSYNSGSGWINESMVQSDEFEWEGYIPSFDNDTHIEFRIYAIDEWGLWSVSEINSYTVIDQVEDNTDISLPFPSMLFTISAIAIIGLLYHKKE